MNGLPYIIKIAAFKASSPPNVHIDWTLDCLQNMFKPDTVSLDSQNFATYYQQVKYYNPDLVISDMEYYTSEIAANLGATLWQCSSGLLNYALANEYKYNLGIFKKYAILTSRSPLQVQRMINIQDNSNCNYVYSHFGDHANAPPLKTGYEWIRPYFQIGKYSKPCQHNMVGASLSPDLGLIQFLRQNPDSVCFIPGNPTSYNNPIIKNIDNESEYYCNLYNSKLFVCGGQTSFLADAFYNLKYTITTVGQDLETATNIAVSEKIKLSNSIFTNIEEKNIVPQLRPEGQFLHEKVQEL